MVGVCHVIGSAHSSLRSSTLMYATGLLLFIASSTPP